MHLVESTKCPAIRQAEPQWYCSHLYDSSTAHHWLCGFIKTGRLHSSIRCAAAKVHLHSRRPTKSKSATRNKLLFRRSSLKRSRHCNDLINRKRVRFVADKSQINRRHGVYSLLATYSALDWIQQPHAQSKARLFYVQSSRFCFGVLYRQRCKVPQERKSTMHFNIFFLCDRLLCDAVTQYRQ